MAGTKTVQLLLLDQSNLVEKDDVWAMQHLEEGLKITKYEDMDLHEDVVICSKQCRLSSAWINQLKETAYSNVNVGTVSPLLSTELYDLGYEIKEPKLCPSKQTDDMLLACTINEAPSTKYNFFEAIYIRHELLQDIGMPDKEAFRDPMQVENWFELARQLGWIHKVCTSVLLFGRVVPDTGKTRFYVQEKHLWDSFLQNIRLYDDLHLENGRKTILHYLLADFQEGMRNNVGGTQFHVSDLVEYQKEKYNVFVLARNGEYLHLTEYVDDKKVQFDFWVGEISDYACFYDKRFEDTCELIIKCLGIDLVHIHHVMWMTLDIFHVAQKNRIPIVLSVHDFYFMCPVLKMIDPQGEPCNKDSCYYNCDKCLSANKKVRDGKKYLAKRYKEYKSAIELTAKIVFPSREAQDMMCQYYPEIAQRASVIGHGIRLPQSRMEHEFAHIKKRIAFIGGISDTKGGPVIYDLITRNPTEYEWYIMGGISYLNLYQLKQKNLHKTGWYKRYEIYDLLKENEIDIVCILSTIAETFCYTLSEATALGIPVLATEVGALASRMKELDSGWLVPRDATAADIEKCLQEIDQSPDYYLTKKKKALAAAVKNLSQMGGEYDALYSEFLCDSLKRLPADIGKISLYRHIEDVNNVADQGQVSLASDSDPYIENLKKEAASLRSRLNELENSPVIRCAIRIRKISFPGKNVLKKIYMFIKK